MTGMQTCGNQAENQNALFLDVCSKDTRIITFIIKVYKSFLKVGNLHSLHNGI